MVTFLLDAAALRRWKKSSFGILFGLQFSVVCNRFRKECVCLVLRVPSSNRYPRLREGKSYQIGLPCWHFCSTGLCLPEVVRISLDQQETHCGSLLLPYLLQCHVSSLVFNGGLPRRFVGEMCVEVRLCWIIYMDDCGLHGKIGPWSTWEVPSFPKRQIDISMSL